MPFEVGRGGCGRGGGGKGGRCGRSSLAAAIVRTRPLPDGCAATLCPAIPPPHHRPPGHPHHRHPGLWQHGGTSGELKGKRGPACPELTAPCLALYSWPSAPHPPFGLPALRSSSTHLHTPSLHLHQLCEQLKAQTTPNQYMYPKPRASLLDQTTCQPPPTTTPPPQPAPTTSNQSNTTNHQVCEQLKVQSQNDAAKLAEAKQLVYLKVRLGYGALGGVGWVFQGFDTPPPPPRTSTRPCAWCCAHVGGQALLPVEADAATCAPT